MKGDNLHIEQINDAVRKITLYSEDVTEEKFLSSELLQSGLMLQLIIIGEVAKKLSEDTKSKLAVPWKEIIGFRDKAVHNYFEMELKVVWNTVQNDIPILKMQLEKFVV